MSTLLSNTIRDVVSSNKRLSFTTKQQQQQQPLSFKTNNKNETNFKLDNNNNSKINSNNKKSNENNKNIDIKKQLSFHTKPIKNDNNNGKQSSLSKQDIIKRPNKVQKLTISSTNIDTNAESPFVILDDIVIILIILKF